MSKIGTILIALCAVANVTLLVVVWRGLETIERRITALDRPPVGSHPVTVEGYVKLDPTTKVGLILDQPLPVRTSGRIGVDALNTVSVIVPDPVSVTAPRPLPVTVRP